MSSPWAACGPQRVSIVPSPHPSHSLFSLSVAAWRGQKCPGCAHGKEGNLPTLQVVVCVAGEGKGAGVVCMARENQAACAGGREEPDCPCCIQGAGGILCSPASPPSHHVCHACVQGPCPCSVHDFRVEIARLCAHQRRQGEGEGALWPGHAVGVSWERGTCTAQGSMACGLSCPEVGQPCPNM